MKRIPVDHAVGMVLVHDVTEIVPGRFKGPAFKRGHVIRPQDVDRLRDLGKENIAALDLAAGWLHEDEAAQRLAAAAAGAGIALSAPSEGKVNLIASRDGLLKIDVDRLNGINAIPDIMMATRHTHQLVTAGQVVAGTRIIPLTIQAERLQAAEARCGPAAPVVAVKSLNPHRVGLITTGSEVYHHRIEDRFGPVVTEKIAALGSRVLRQICVPDDIPMTVAAIEALIAEGAQIVLITGGMSVDPDDLTPGSIRATGAEVITYGAPVLPGAMFMLAYLDDRPVIGLPGCVMYHKSSIFDLLLPRILTGERLTREDIVVLGHGGMCLGCADCRYPSCSFGK
ncbi:MAG: molybdopterin-binding protein [Desulfobacterales bacterium]